MSASFIMSFTICWPYLEIKVASDIDIIIDYINYHHYTSFYLLNIVLYYSLTFSECLLPSRSIPQRKDRYWNSTQQSGDLRSDTDPAMCYECCVTVDFIFVNIQLGIIIPKFPKFPL